MYVVECSKMNSSQRSLLQISDTKLKKLFRVYDKSVAVTKPRLSILRREEKSVLTSAYFSNCYEIYHNFIKICNGIWSPTITYNGIDFIHEHIVMKCLLRPKRFIAKLYLFMNPHRASYAWFLLSCPCTEILLLIRDAIGFRKYRYQLTWKWG